MFYNIHIIKEVPMLNIGHGPVAPQNLYFVGQYTNRYFFLLSSIGPSTQTERNRYIKRSLFGISKAQLVHSRII